jgi:hypothetical protein
MDTAAKPDTQARRRFPASASRQANAIRQANGANAFRQANKKSGAPLEGARRFLLRRRGASAAD